MKGTDYSASTRVEANPTEAFKQINFKNKIFGVLT